MHHAVPAFVFAVDEHAQIARCKAPNIVVQRCVGSSGQQIQIGSCHPSIGLNARLGQHGVHVVVNALFASKQGHAEVHEVLHLFVQQGFLLLTELFENARS